MGQEKKPEGKKAHDVCHAPCKSCNAKGELDNKSICPECGGTGCKDQTFCAPAGGLGCEPESKAP